MQLSYVLNYKLAESFAFKNISSGQWKLLSIAVFWQQNAKLLACICLAVYLSSKTMVFHVTEAHEGTSLAWQFQPLKACPLPNSGAVRSQRKAFDISLLSTLNVGDLINLSFTVFWYYEGVRLFVYFECLFPSMIFCVWVLSFEDTCRNLGNV